jgi:hypothetical protein
LNRLSISTHRSDISVLPVEERICCKVEIRCFLSNRSSGTVPNGPPKRTIPRTHGKYQQNQFEKVYFSQQYLPSPHLAYSLENIEYEAMQVLDDVAAKS